MGTESTRTKYISATLADIHDVISDCLWNEKLSDLLRNKLEMAYQAGSVEGRAQKEGANAISIKQAESRGYEKGCEDAWKFAKSCILGKKHPAFKDVEKPEDIVKNVSAKTALLRIRIYEKGVEAMKKEEEIKVGDEVKFSIEDDSGESLRGVVVSKKRNGISVLWSTGVCGSGFKAEELVRTGVDYPGLDNIIELLNRKGV